MAPLMCNGFFSCSLISILMKFTLITKWHLVINPHHLKGTPPHLYIFLYIYIYYVIADNLMAPQGVEVLHFELYIDNLLAPHILS